VIDPTGPLEEVDAELTELWLVLDVINLVLDDDCDE
jgi:hypothetical protein